MRKNADPSSTTTPSESDSSRALELTEKILGMAVTGVGPFKSAETVADGGKNPLTRLTLNTSSEDRAQLRFGQGNLGWSDTTPRRPHCGYLSVSLRAAD